MESHCAACMIYGVFELGLHLSSHHTMEVTRFIRLYTFKICLHSLGRSQHAWRLSLYNKYSDRVVSVLSYHYHSR